LLTVIHRDSMEIPVHDVVNTGTELLREGLPGKQGFITVSLAREAANQPWGFRLQGGKDRGLPFQLLKVPLDSIASHSGCKSGDYLVKINGENVFNLGHEEAKDLIRRAGNKLALVVERGEMIVPSMNTAFPKPKTEDEADNKPKSYSQMVLEKTGRLPGQKDHGFTTVGKPKMASKQYNSPMKMYSDDIIEEIMTQGTAFGKEIDPANPWNMTGKEFEPEKSGVLAAILDADKTKRVDTNHHIA